MYLGANLDIKDNDGNTALFYAAAKGHLQMVDFLIGSGANIYTYIYSIYFGH